MKLRMETSSMFTCETKPGLAMGEITSIGTRIPNPWLALAGGFTWSYHPPPSSQTTTMAVSGHTAEACTFWTVSVSQFKPTTTSPDPGCIECVGPGCTNTTEGNVLLSSWEKKLVRSWMCS